MSQLHSQDHIIDQVLTALRDTPAPTGLEARIAHRLLQAQNVPVQPRPFQFAVILSFAKDLRMQLAAATALAVALAIPLAHHRLANWQTGNWQTENQPRTTSTARTQPALNLPAAPRHHAAHSHNPTTTSTTTPDDPDTIALAETLAPSQPIPQQPLTAEERLLLRATRQGQPIEVAELELAREPVLRAAAEARERFTFAQVARSLLAPLAEAEAIESTTPSTDAQPESPR